MERQVKKSPGVCRGGGIVTAGIETRIRADLDSISLSLATRLRQVFRKLFYATNCFV